MNMTCVRSVLSRLKIQMNDAAIFAKLATCIAH